jgi:hypothetical protein
VLFTLPKINFYAKKHLIIAVVLALNACQKPEDVSNAGAPVDQARKGDDEGPMIIGEQLKNPYSVANMQKAWDSLLTWDETGITQGVQLNIQATHLYVKFKPQNEEELSALKRDTTIAYYTYPLDHAIVRQGHYYHDPAISPELPTFQYAAVPVGKDLPNVSYDVLAHLFIPDEYKDGVEGPLGNNDGLIEALVETALVMTGNLEVGRIASGAGARVSNNSKWRPAGVVQVLDNSSTPNFNRPMTGVKVKARRWFTTHTGVTGTNGHYSVDGQFRRPANYNLDWERHDFAIRRGWLAGAHFNGPHQRGDWNPIWNHGEQMHYARIFMAAELYYYGHIFGLRRPPLNGPFSTQLRIRLMDTPDPDGAFAAGTHKASRRFLSLGSQIKIWRFSTFNDIQNLFGVVIHELAHASHWAMTDPKSHYHEADDIVIESWARGVEFFLTRSVYGTYTPSFFRMKDGHQPDPRFYNYTGLVRDLVDVDNSAALGDQVSNYTLRQVEDELRNTRHWNPWRDKIKTNITNSTSTHVDALYDYWN